jgi:hypothetical protein
VVQPVSVSVTTRRPSRASFVFMSYYSGRLIIKTEMCLSSEK